MFVDLCPGESIRIGGSVVMTLLDIHEGGLHFTLEGVMPTPGPPDERQPQEEQPTLYFQSHIAR